MIKILFGSFVDIITVLVYDISYEIQDVVVRDVCSNNFYNI